MNIKVDYRLLIFIGFLMVLAGVILPFLMVMRILESTFFLNFLAHGVSVAGLILGVIGLASYSQLSQNRHNDDR